MVFSFDDKTQIQALDRTQPSLPIRPGRNRTMTHDYKRNGTVDLFTALDIATGEVLTQTRKRHTGADVSAFFKEIDHHTPDDLDVHVISDDLSAHKSQPYAMARTPRPRTLASSLHPHQFHWTNLIEGCFSVLTRKTIKNRAFTSVADLDNVICDWTAHRNHNPQPLRWTKPPKRSPPKPNEPKRPKQKKRGLYRMVPGGWGCGWVCHRVLVVCGCGC